MRRYEVGESSANYYNGYDHGLCSANPMASMFWLGQNGEAATNLSHQPNTSYYDHIECFNGTVMDMRAPQSSK